MKAFTDDEKIQIFHASVEGKKLEESRGMALSRQRVAESREKQTAILERNLAEKRDSLFQRIKKRKEKFAEVLSLHKQGVTKTLQQIFNKEKLVQENLDILTRVWKAKKREANPESFGILQDLERHIRKPFLPDSGYEEAI